MIRSLPIAVLLTLWLAVAGQAATLTVGSHVISPNATNQQIQLFVVGAGEFVQGLNFNLQVADGGPEASGSIDGPEITAVDILTGTIFAGNNNGDNGTGSIVPQVWESGTTTASGTVEADGLLATITFDTTGFFSGTFDLIASNTLNGPTDFAAPTPVLTVTDGQIILPEPSAWALLTAGILGAAALVAGQARRRNDSLPA